MIYVPKPRSKIPPAFSKAAADELKQVLPLFQRAGGRKPAFTFRAYRNAALVQVLQELFNLKCAYCEANYAATSYVEVEHYRPKSHYYWLAADWSNLLPSCKRCNNGKLSKFPLADPRKQAKRKGQEKRERPLLLNPSDSAPSRRPERHLTFDPTDGAVRPVVSRGRPSELGTASIEVYRLARSELSQLRKEWAKRVRGQVAFCRLASAKGNQTQRDLAFQAMKELLEPGQPFRALTLHVLRESGFTSRR